MCRLLQISILLLLSSVAHFQVHKEAYDSFRTNNGRGTVDYLLTGCVPDETNCVEGSHQHQDHVEYESYDGWYNNFARPDLGAIDTALLRLLPPAYRDGVYQPAKREANPISVSDGVMKGDNGMLSNGAKTAFLVFFGQQVVEEVLDAQRPGCPPEYFNIDIPEGHKYREESPNLKIMPLLRTRYDMSTGFSPNNPRQQLNEITPYIDGGLFYGVAKGWADSLRTNAQGQLAPRGKLAGHSELGDDFPVENIHRLPMANPPPPTNHSQFVEEDETAKVNRFFKLGNPRGNENPFLLTFGVLFYRWHNVIATKLARQHADWNDERVFNEARKWVIGTYQNLVMYDWLPKWLREPLPNYTSYKPTVDPQVSHVFQSAAMRFGHTLVPSGVYLRDRASEGCGTVNYNLKLNQGTDGGVHSAGVRTCNSFWRSPELFTENPKNIERFLMGMASQSSEKEDNIIVEDLRGSVFGPLEFSRRDLMAINIQRGRDHGLPDYNTARKNFNLDTLDNLEPDEFIEKTSSVVNRDVIERLRELYGNDPDKMDIWPGGILETRKYGPGQLFTNIIKDQFERIRDGDRFWFENVNNGQFTPEEISRIKDIRIIDIIQAVTNLTVDDIQMDPFTAIHSENQLSGTQCDEVLSSQTSCMPHSASAYDNETTCFYLPALGDTNLESCSKLKTFDYFSGSEVSYIATFTAIGTFAAVLIASLLFFAHRKQEKKSRSTLRKTKKFSEKGYLAKEYTSRMESRTVEIIFKKDQKRIEVLSDSGALLRTIDLQNLKSLKIRHLTNKQRIVIQVEHHHDLNLKFSDTNYGQQLFSAIEAFCSDVGLEAEISSVSFFFFSPVRFFFFWLKNNITTSDDRAKELSDFSRLVLNEAFESDKMKEGLRSILDMASSIKDHPLFSMQITKLELAAELGTSADTLFMQQLFKMMDKDGNGFIRMKEFWDVMIVFANGSAREKALLVFNIYDVSQTGALTEKDLQLVIKSMLGNEGKDRDMEALIGKIMTSVNLKPGQNIDFETFFELFNDNDGILDEIHLQGKTNARAAKTFSIYGLGPKKVQKPVVEKDSLDKLLDKEDTKVSTQTSWFGRKWMEYKSYVHNNAVFFLWTALYTLVTGLIFAERCYFYSVEREHGGLRRVAGYGVSITRGAASAMMFTYSTLLITMCRNIFTLIRYTSIHRILPIDDMVAFHRYIGSWAIIFTVVHIIGHAVNFYNIATQTSSDLSCLFRDYFRSTHVLPKFHYWCWGTITGLTGVLLTLQCIVIYVFAYIGRRQFFKQFWWTHNTYPLFYLLMILHGSGNLVQPPFFHYFFLAPVLLFCIDKLMSISVNSVKLDVLEAQHLPSGVTLLKIRRPPNFSYQAGQWIRIASLAISKQEYHPFTISSAPNEPHVTVHIRAVGPWTRRIRKEYPDKKTTSKMENHKYPEIYMDGPFGEGHQRWWEYDVSILIGGGIGVTPFASILKHIAHCSQQSNFTLRTKRVLFLWVTKSQNQFEWLTEILQKVEDQDTRGLIRNHIFITQFKNKFDMRTIFLYMAERHFQRVSGTSLFTGLKAITHFSRPSFPQIFRTVRNQYSSLCQTSKIGVFTCGAPSLSASVEDGCRAVNQDPNGSIIFKHYAENF